MLAISFIAGIYLAMRRAKHFGIDYQHVLDLSVYIILSAVVGSRVLYVAFHLEEYSSILDMFALWEGGATLYGGLSLAILSSYLFAKKRRLGFLVLADIVSPSLALGIMLTRIGCFMSGCCFGKATSLPWGVVFPPECAAGIYSRQLAGTPSGTPVPLHPVQLYASLYGLITLLVLLALQRRIRKTGGLFGAFLILYGVFRFAVDFLRVYEENMRVLWGLTLNQLLSAGLLMIGVFLLSRKISEKSLPDTPGPP